MWTVWTLAVRFMREGKAQSALIIGGIAVGVAVIVFLSALISGLQDNIIDRTLGTQAHVKVEPAEEVNHVPAPPAGTRQLLLEEKRAQRLRSINNWQEVLLTLDTLPGIRAVSPLVSGPAFARRGEARVSVALMGIDAPRYQQLFSIQQYMREGAFRVGADDVVIGSQLARDLGLRVGHKLRLDGGEGRETTVNITGIFELGVRELDARYIYTDMKRAQSILDLPGAATAIDLTVEDIFGADLIASRVGRLTGLKAESWMETSAQLMNALRSQRLSTQMINFFVALSVALGIASVLSVSVVQRTREIGILRAMGSARHQILQIFLLQGALLGLLGSILGSLAGWGLLYSFKTFGPRLFEVSMSPALFGFAAVLATVTGVLSAAVPARRAAGLDPVEAIRHV